MGRKQKQCLECCKPFAAFDDIFGFCEGCVKKHSEEDEDSRCIECKCPIDDESCYGDYCLNCAAAEGLYTEGYEDWCEGGDEQYLEKE